MLSISSWLLILFGFFSVEHDLQVNVQDIPSEYKGKDL